MLFIAYAAAPGEFHHPALFYLAIAVFGVVIVSAIVISLLTLVLRNVDREWPVRTIPRPAPRHHLPHRRHPV
jgi:hypothetical protein